MSTIDDIAGEVQNSYHIEFKDPFETPYGDPERTTNTQEKGWRLLTKQNVWRQAWIAAKGAGKAESLDQSVLTPAGWKRMGDIEVGNKVIGRNGTATKVIGVYPQGVRPVCEVTFSDGTTLKVDEDHLWAVRTGWMKHRGNDWKVCSTKELMGDLKTSQGYNKWHVPIVDPVQFNENGKRPIPPYALGALLGDGGLTTSTPAFFNNNYEIVKRVASETGAKAKERSSGSGKYLLINGGKLKSELEFLDLHGKNAHNKFIPQSYLRASVEDRKKLLRGLMDTDGTVTRRNTGSFTSVSKELADGVVEIVRSLGGVTQRKKRKTNGGCGYAYRVRMNLPFNPFWVDRKAEEFNTEATQGRTKSIENIEYVGEEPTQCIKVDAEDSLYVTEGYTVTHNTYFGASFAFYFGQNYPDCHIALVANTDRQAKDAAGEHFLTMARSLGYPTEYFRTKKLNQQEYSKFYVVDLDGQGFEEGQTFKLFVRSLESVNAMEGTEFDAVWFEELQDANKDRFIKALSRVRGTGIVDPDTPRPAFIAGMSDAEEHWMYSHLENNMGFVVENFFDASKHAGILMEPSLYDNIQNVGQATIDEYLNNYDETKARRLVHGERVSASGNLAAYSFSSHQHRKGRMSELSAFYDPNRKLYISIDFNVSPMCATAWQEKPWSDEWTNDNILIDYSPDGSIRRVEVYDEPTGEIDLSTTEPTETYDHVVEYAEPDRSILAQVDEWQVFPDDSKGGGTEGLMQHICDDYSSHPGQVVILGDASGEQRDPGQMTRTNWDIVEERAAESMHDPVVIRGLMQNTDMKKGTTKYYNPPVEQTLNVMNATLRNAQRQVSMCFMKASEYESGGAASSLAVTKTKPDGSIEKKRDRSEDREKPRTHFLDTVRYMTWYWTDGGSKVATNNDATVTEGDVNRPDNRRDEGMLSGYYDEEDDLGDYNPYDNEWLL